MDQAELCDSFVRISMGTWRWLRRAWRVRNPSLTKHASSWSMSLHETTLTDHIVLRLLEECAPAVSVFTFPPMLEAQTGADLELWITDSTHRWLGLRVQCKVLSPDGYFRELHYQQRNGQYQSDLLIQAAQRVPSCLPVYLLYVGPYRPTILSKGWRCPSCSPYSPSGCPRPWGNWWLSAYQVKKIRPHNRLDEIGYHMKPWHCIVCCPWPDIRRLTIRSIYAQLRETVFAGDAEVREREIGELREPPRYVKLALEGALPEAVEAFRSLLEGREMQHLVILDLGQLEGERIAR